MTLKELIQTYIRRKLESERQKNRARATDYIFNQKKQIWYNMMDAIDGKEPIQPNTDSSDTQGSKGEEIS